MDEIYAMFEDTDEQFFPNSGRKRKTARKKMPEKPEKSPAEKKLELIEADLHKIRLKNDEEQIQKRAAIEALRKKKAELDKDHIRVEKMYTEGLEMMYKSSEKLDARADVLIDLKNEIAESTKNIRKLENEYRAKYNDMIDTIRENRKERAKNTSDFENKEETKKTEEAENDEIELKSADHYLDRIEKELAEYKAEAREEARKKNEARRAKENERAKKAAEAQKKREEAQRAEARRKAEEDAKRSEMIRQAERNADKLEREMKEKRERRKKKRPEAVKTAKTAKAPKTAKTVRNQPSGNSKNNKNNQKTKNKNRTDQDFGEILDNEILDLFG